MDEGQELNSDTSPIELKSGDQDKYRIFFRDIGGKNP